VALSQFMGIMAIPSPKVALQPAKCHLYGVKERRQGFSLPRGYKRKLANEPTNIKELSALASKTQLAALQFPLELILLA